MREAKAVNKILGWPEQNTTRPTGRRSPALRGSRHGRNGQLGWSTTTTGKKWKGDFWLMISWTEVLHRKILGPSQLPAGFGPWFGWKQWKHPKNAAYPKPFWWKYITEFLVVHLKLLQCFKLEVRPNSSIDPSCTVQPAQLNMITIYSSSRHGSGENGSLQYVFPFIRGYTPNNTNNSGKNNDLKMHFPSKKRWCSHPSR